MPRCICPRPLPKPVKKALYHSILDISHILKDIPVVYQKRSKTCYGIGIVDCQWDRPSLKSCMCIIPKSDTSPFLDRASALVLHSL